MADIGKCVRNKATGFVRDWRLLEAPPFDKETEELVECASLESAKPQAQVSRESVPRSVTPLQFRRAIRKAKLIQKFKDAIQAATEEVRETIEYMTEVRRDDKDVVAILAAMKLTDAEMDGLFRAAGEN